MSVLGRDLSKIERKKFAPSLERRKEQKAGYITPSGLYPVYR